MVPFRPETWEAQQARWPLALVDEYTEADTSPERRPGNKPHHIFDWQDPTNPTLQCRLIASIENLFEPLGRVLHISYSRSTPGMPSMCEATYMLAQLIGRSGTIVSLVPPIPSPTGGNILHLLLAPPDMPTGQALQKMARVDAWMRRRMAAGEPNGYTPRKESPCASSPSVN